MSEELPEHKPNLNGHASLPMHQAAHEADPEASATPPWVKLHAMLRGRYKWAVPLAMVGAILGAAAGWAVTAPVYNSRGMIQIKPRIDAILYKTDQSSVMPMFDSFVETQIQLMNSARVLDSALNDPAWNRVAGADAPTTATDFREPLSVRRQRGSNLVHIGYTHADVETARVAVNAVMDAYMRLYGEQDIASENKRLSVLTERRDRLSNEISALEQDIRSLAKQYATDSLEQHYQFKLATLQEIEAARNETELALTTAGVDLEEVDDASMPAERGPQGGEARASERSDEPVPAGGAYATEQDYAAAAAASPVVRQALQSRRQAKRRLENYADKYGKHHRAYDQAQDAVASAEDALELAMASHRNRVAMGQSVGGEGEVNVARLLRQYRKLSQLYKQAKEETRAIGRRNQQIKSLKRDMRDDRQKLEETKLAIETINVERAAAGRVEVISQADVPQEPANASKRKQLVVLGFGGGGMAGFALILAVALLDRRVRYSDDVLPSNTSDNDLRALGILPHLPPNPETREQSESTAYAVHHIRTLLQVGHRGGPVTAITGPVSGSGKTSLTVALGLSFASTGDETLLIDADFIGAGLTRRMEGFRRERLGDILLRIEAIDEAQLKQAVEHAGTQNVRLGEALVDLGVLSEEDIDRALSLQRESCPGLLEALRGGSASECIAETGVPHLRILPLLDASASQVAAANPEAVERVLREVSGRYRHVLIDLGPVPGSVEASVLAAAADRTMLVVSRGDAKPRYDGCVEFLRSLGTPLAGVVFNRAGVIDMQQSAAFSASASRSLSVSRGESRSRSRKISQRNGHAADNRFGPLGEGVAPHRDEKS